jgi:hypothetical protein
LAWSGFRPESIRLVSFDGRSTVAARSFSPPSAAGMGRAGFPGRLPPGLYLAVLSSASGSAVLKVAAP